MALGEKTKMKFLNKSRKKEILRVLEKKYGIDKKLNYLFIEIPLASGGSEVRIFSGNIDKVSLVNLSAARIVTLGLGLCFIKANEINFVEQTVEFLKGL